MPNNKDRRKIKRLEREILANYPAYMALLQEQARRDAERAKGHDPHSALKEAITSTSRERLN
jgi:hypothetical protein